MVMGTITGTVTGTITGTIARTATGTATGTVFAPGVVLMVLTVVCSRGWVLKASIDA